MIEHEYEFVVNEMGVCVTATMDNMQYRPIDVCTETITPPQPHVHKDIITVVRINLIAEKLPNIYSVHFLVFA